MLPINSWIKRKSFVMVWAFHVKTEALVLLVDCIVLHFVALSPGCHSFSRVSHSSYIVCHKISEIYGCLSFLLQTASIHEINTNPLCKSFASLHLILGLMQPAYIYT